jgi:hypothetical protein
MHYSQGVLYSRRGKEGTIMILVVDETNSTMQWIQNDLVSVIVVKMW